MYTEERAIHEDEENAKIAYTNALETKVKARRLEQWMRPIHMETQDLLQHPDKADRNAILNATNYMMLAMLELKTVGEKPVSAKP